MRYLIVVLLIIPLLFLSSCSREVAGGAALGVGAAGAVYEYSNKEALEDLEEDYEAGRISADEYQRRKEEIEERSVVY